MRKIFVTCDICGKDCTNDPEFSTFAGRTIKTDMELKQQLMGFEGHYCGEHTEKILNFIQNAKN